MVLWMGNFVFKHTHVLLDDLIYKDTHNTKQRSLHPHTLLDGSPLSQCFHVYSSPCFDHILAGKCMLIR
jgi:hypothetical protein